LKFHYYSATDSLYIDLLERESVESHEVSKGIVLDFDENGSLVGIDIDHASKNIDLNSLSIEDLPVGNLSLTKSAAV
jgi:uncharacterized protein YuzE